MREAREDGSSLLASLQKLVVLFLPCSKGLLPWEGLKRRSCSLQLHERALMHRAESFNVSLIFEKSGLVFKSGRPRYP